MVMRGQMAVQDTQADPVQVEAYTDCALVAPVAVQP